MSCCVLLGLATRFSICRCGFELVVVSQLRCAGADPNDFTNHTKIWWEALYAWEKFLVRILPPIPTISVLPPTPTSIRKALYAWRIMVVAVSLKPHDLNKKKDFLPRQYSIRTWYVGSPQVLEGTNRTVLVLPVPFYSGPLSLLEDPMSFQDGVAGETKPSIISLWKGFGL